MSIRMTKRGFFWMLTSAVFLGAAWTGYVKLQAQWRKSASDLFREGTIRRGDVRFEVKCSGTVQPILSVQVGAFVSGPIQKVCVDFNDRVKQGQLLAEIDPQVFKAQCRQAKSLLDHSMADLEQCKAKLHLTERDFKRAKELYCLESVPGAKKTVKAITESDYDMAEANYEMAVANVNLAKATVEQNQATLEMAEANLGYTRICSPRDGVIIDRKVDEGQTLASQYQTPVMFIVAPELEKRVWILASIDEADIGLVRKAEQSGRSVMFTVDAYRNEQFEGKIIQVRLGPKATLPNAQVNVVTYIAVVEAPNAELKLLPGMTANLVFRIDEHRDVLLVPNAALRFHPKPEFVHPKHLAVLEGLKNEDEREEGGTTAKDKQGEDDEENHSDAKKNDGESNGENGQNSTPNVKKNADDKAASPSKEESGRKKYVWVVEGDRLAPVEVAVGLSDARRTELVGGDLKEREKVVTGMKTAAEAASGKTPH
jgi:HlyD family secretion protein